MINSGKYIFITGVNGIIGSHVAKRLLDEGYKVIGLGRLPKCSFVHNNLTYFQADISDSTMLQTILKSNKTYAVIHLAAIVHKKSNDLSYESYSKTNYHASKSLFELCGENHVEKVLFASTVEVYGEQNLTTVDETALCNPKSYYGQTKLAAEKSLLALAESTGFDYAVMRFSPVYSKNFTLNIDRRVYLLKKSIAYYFKDGNYSFNFCSVENISDFIVAYLDAENSESGIFNISDSNNIDVKKIIELEKSCNSLKIALKLPYGICKVLIILFEQLYRLILKKETGMSSYNFNKLFRSTVFSNKKAEKVVRRFKWDIENTLYKRY